MRRGQDYVTFEEKESVAFIDVVAGTEAQLDGTDISTYYTVHV